MFLRSRSSSLSFGDRQRRSRWQLPGWFWLILGGVAAGAGGVLYLQEQVLPPRLSPEDSARLTAAFGQADADRARLTAELGQKNTNLEAALAEGKALGAELAGSRAAVTRLRDDLASVIDALPPDPRGGPVAVRAARFSATGAELAYEVVLSRERATGKPLAGVMQLVVTGTSTRPNETSAALKPVSVSLGSHEVMRGRLPLPEGFRPQQATVKILDRPAGQLLGSRVLVVR
jgi:hypothetical protein